MGRIVECRIEHSKTGYSRYFEMAGLTVTSQIDVAGFFKDYWHWAGFHTVTEMQAGLQVVKPDFWVLRVSLLGLDEKKMQQLITWTRWCKFKSIRYHQGMGTTERYIRQRYQAMGIGSQEKKYINLMGSFRANPELDEATAELTKLGFEARVVPGPMLLATTGGGRPKLTCMPLSTASAFAPTKEILQKSYELANIRPDDPDVELERAPGEPLKWTTHSLRRLADTVARRFRLMMEVSEDEIDVYMGWHERVLLKAMQVHYAAMNIRERMKKARITCML